MTIRKKDGNISISFDDDCISSDEDSHFECLKLFPLSLTTQESRCSVLDEPGFSFGETSDIRRNEVLGRDTSRWSRALRFS